MNCPPNNTNLRTCAKCKIEYPETDYLSKGYRGYCRLCRQEKDRKYRTAHKEAVTKRKQLYYKNNKDLIDQKRKLYQEQNKEKIKEYHKKYYEINKEMKVEKSRKYAREHHKEILLRNQKYEKNRKSIDPIFAMRRRLKTLIRKTFREAGLNTTSSATDIIGLASNDFYAHLINTFKNNYGRPFIFGEDDVHIDHIIPMCSATSSEDLIRLNHYTNLQLLLAKDNLKKGGKLGTTVQE